MITLALGYCWGRWRRDRGVSVTDPPSAPDRERLQPRPPLASKPDLHLVRRELDHRRLVLFHDLARDVGHDFKNLLTSVIGFCELACCTLDEHSAIHADLDQVRLAAKRGATLADRLHAFSRSGAQRSPLGDLVGHVIEALQPTLPRDLELTVDIEPGSDLAVTMTDSDVEASLLELLGNARAATSDRGLIEIACRRVGDHLQITCRDSGCGIPAPWIERLGQPDFTTRAPQHGEHLGLGLLGVRSLVEQHGGRVQLATRIGAGSEVTVILPSVAHRPEVPAAAQVPLPAASPAPAGNPAATCHAC